MVRTWHAMSGHRSLRMGMVWVWVQFKGKMLGSSGYTLITCKGYGWISFTSKDSLLQSTNSEIDIAGSFHA